MNPAGQDGKGRTREPARAQMMILALVFFLLGVAAGAFWFSGKPPWKAAPQSDLTYAPARSASANVSPEPPPAPTDLAALDAVKRSIPRLNSASFEEGTRILRAAALAELRQTAEEWQARQQQAEHNFIQGQNNHSDAQQQMAAKQLRQLQAEQLEKLQQIAAKSQAQIETLQQLKETSR